MKHTHTPAPWKLEAGRMLRTVSGDFYLSYKTDKTTSAPAFQNFSELDANAHLISAAPDLLSALQWFANELPGIIRQYCPEGVPIRVANAHDAARNAIAKAKGEI